MAVSCCLVAFVDMTSSSPFAAPILFAALTAATVVIAGRNDLDLFAGAYMAMPLAAVAVTHDWIGPDGILPSPFMKSLSIFVFGTMLLISTKRVYRPAGRAVAAAAAVVALAVYIPESQCRTVIPVGHDPLFGCANCLKKIPNPDFVRFSVSESLFAFNKSCKANSLRF
jgi:hypothetical protein